MKPDLLRKILDVECPGASLPDHYALLGIKMFEQDIGVIHRAGLRQMKRLKEWQLHPDPEIQNAVQEMLNEVSRACTVLEVSEKKAEYDLILSAETKIGLPLTISGAKGKDEDLPIPILGQEKTDDFKASAPEGLLLRSCPKCGTAASKLSILCINCGYHFENGEVIHTETESEEISEVQKSETIPDSADSWSFPFPSWSRGLISEIQAIYKPPPKRSCLRYGLYLMIFFPFFIIFSGMGRTIGPVGILLFPILWLFFWFAGIRNCLRIVLVLVRVLFSALLRTLSYVPWKSVMPRIDLEKRLGLRPYSVICIILCCDSLLIGAGVLVKFGWDKPDQHTAPSSMQNQATPVLPAVPRLVPRRTGEHESGEKENRETERSSATKTKPELIRQREENEKHAAEERARIMAEQEKRIAEERARLAAEAEQKRQLEAEQARIVAEHEKRIAEERARIAAEQEKKRQAFLGQISDLVLKRQFERAKKALGSDSEGHAPGISELIQGLCAVDKVIIDSFRTNNILQIRANNQPRTLIVKKIEDGKIYAEERFDGAVFQSNVPLNSLTTAEKAARIRSLPPDVQAVYLGTESLREGNLDAAEKLFLEAGILSDPLLSVLETRFQRTDAKGTRALRTILRKAGYYGGPLSPETIKQAMSRKVFTDEDETELRQFIQKYQSAPSSKVTHESALVLQAILEQIRANRIKKVLDPYTIGDLSMQLVPIQAGSFKREGVATSIEEPFWMGKTEVTQGQYAKVMGKSSIATRIKRNDPVAEVSWTDAMKFCERLTAREQANLPKGYTFRLPTVPEWEYACKAGLALPSEMVTPPAGFRVCLAPAPKPPEAKKRKTR